MSFLQYHSPIEDKPSLGDRPATVKAENEPMKRVSRPISASKQFPVSKSGALLKAKRPTIPDAATLSRLKPKHIALDKERLYEEALALKMEANYFREENVKLRTKLQQLEREIDKRDGALEGMRTTTKERHFSATLQSAHLIANLKNTVKDLRTQLKAQEEEANKVKRDTRISRISELEVELRAYVDECTRLKHHLEDVMERMVQHTEDLEATGKVIDEKKALEDDLRVRTEDWEQAKKQIKQQEQTIKSANLREKELNEQIKALKSQLDKLCQSQRKVSIAEEGRLIADLAQARQELLAEKENSQSLEAEIKQLKSDLKTLQSRISKQNTESKKLSIVLKQDPSDEEDDRAMIAAIEKSTGVSLVEFVEKCSQVLTFTSIPKKKIVKSVIEAVPIVASELKLALQAVGMETTLTEVQAAIEQPAIMKDLLEVLQTPPKTQTASLNPSGNGTFRIKDDVENQIAPYFPEFKTPAEGSFDQNSPKSLPESTATALKGFAFRFQLHRIPKGKLGTTLFGEKYESREIVTSEQITKMLGSPPLSMSNLEEIEVIVKFVMECDAGLTPKNVTSWISAALEDWEVFTPSDESDFDRHISETLSRSKASFLDACLKHDLTETGNITMKSLKEICQALQFDFNSREYHYLELLFFSLNYTLDQVPYNKLIQAYAMDDSQLDSFESNRKEAGDEDLISNSERKKIVREYMELIAGELQRKSLDTRQVFRGKEGILYPDKLMAGMRTLGIPDMQERDLVVLLEALQCEDLDEYGIEMSLFEEIVSGCRGPEGRPCSAEHSL